MEEDWRLGIKSENMGMGRRGSHAFGWRVETCILDMPKALSWMDDDPVKLTIGLSSFLSGGDGGENSSTTSR